MRSNWSDEWRREIVHLYFENLNCQWKGDDSFEQSACNTKILILRSLFQMRWNQKWHSKYPRNCRRFGRNPTSNVVRSVDNARATAAFRKRVNKRLTNALIVQFHPIKLFCLVVKQSFFRRCPTVPVHRRPAPSCQQTTVIRKSDRTSENAPKPIFPL